MSIPKETYTVNNVCEWITVTAPSETFKQKSPAFRLWQNVLRSLCRLTTVPGFQACHWSRVLEDQQQIYIWILWAYKATYDAQKLTTTHAALYERSNFLSITQPETTVLQFELSKPFQRNAARHTWPSITMLKFAAPITSRQYEKLTKMLNMSQVSVWGNRAIDSHPTREFLLREDNEQTELSSDTYIFLDY